ncbi:hypothetical protein ACFQO7_31165 [Catellatospora aurea]|uniref:Uncharacterized protein n=1 Tax=Catellatospora aurea TaxID=1337874 RepID=A0ABW2H3W8_9ACTN
MTVELRANGCIEDFPRPVGHDRLVITTTAPLWSIESTDEHAPQTEEAHLQQMRMSFVGYLRVRGAT